MLTIAAALLASPGAVHKASAETVDKALGSLQHKLDQQIASRHHLEHKLHSQLANHRSTDQRLYALNKKITKLQDEEDPTGSTWVAGNYHASCDAACQSNGLQCTDDALYRHSGDVDTYTEMTDLLESIGSAPCTHLWDSDELGELKGVPAFATDDSDPDNPKTFCEFDKPDRDASTFDCSISPKGHNAKRLCFCVPGVSPPITSPPPPAPSSPPPPPTPISQTLLAGSDAYLIAQGGDEPNHYNSLMSPGGLSRLTILEDGTLQVVDTATEGLIWNSTDTYFTQNNPNVVITMPKLILNYRTGLKIMSGTNMVWSQNIYGLAPGAYLTVQDDCNLVVYADNGDIKWQTGTYCIGGDGDIVPGGGGDAKKHAKARQSMRKSRK